MAAGINLFGGALGLLHRHVTGAIPIRRNSKDPLYLVTLRAYVAEVLEAPRPALLRGRRAQLQRRAEVAQDRPAAGRAAGGSERAVGRADGGRLRPRARGADARARRRAARHTRPFAQEVAEMARHAVGYHTRAFVTFGRADPARASTTRSRGATSSRSTHRIQRRDRPALQSAADGARRGRDAAADDARRAGGAHRRPARPLRGQPARISPSRPARQAVEEGVELLIERGVLVAERQRLRVRDRIVLRYYARTIEHLLSGTPRDDALMLEAVPKAVFSSARRQRTTLKRLASRYGMRRPDELRPPIRRRRVDRRGHRRGARARARRA